MKNWGTARQIASFYCYNWEKNIFYSEFHYSLGNPFLGIHRRSKLCGSLVLTFAPIPLALSTARDTRKYPSLPNTELFMSYRCFFFKLNAPSFSFQPLFHMTQTPTDSISWWPLLGTLYRSWIFYLASDSADAILGDIWKRPGSLTHVSWEQHPFPQASLRIPWSP